MTRDAQKLLVLAATGAMVATATAQESPSSLFAEPVRLLASDKLLGEHRLFPSPVFHDMNGDHLADIVVGDLWGRLTVALRKPGSVRALFDAETPLMDVDGKEIDFHNW